MSVAQFTRRRFNLAVTAAASAVCAPLLAQNAWPNKPIRIIVRGGLQNRLQQTVVVDNKPGANSIIGVDMLAKAPADGSTFAVVIAAYAANTTLYPKLPYDPRKDLTGVSLPPWVRSPPVAAQKSLTDLSPLSPANGPRLSRTPA